MNREKLRDLLRKSREEFGQDWEENWKKIHEIYWKFVDRIINGEDPRSLEYGDLELELRNKYRDIDRCFWFIFGVKGAEELSDRDVEKFREFLREISNSSSENEATEILKKYGSEIRGLGIASLATWASIIHPKWFAPLWGNPQARGGPRGVINSHNASILGVNTSIRSFDQYNEVLTKIKEVAKEIGIDNMIEIAFYLSKYSGTLNVDEREGGISKRNTNEELKKQIVKINHILNSKKQIILYGPPGTGKTWLAKKFVEVNVPKTYRIKKKSIEGVKFFWWTINPNRWDYTQLKEGKSEEMWHGQLKKAFEEINDGDVVFIYVGGKLGKIYAVGTYEEKDGKPCVKIQKILDGPSWRNLKDDPLLKNSLPVKMGARGTLFPLESDEGLRICELSNLNLNELGLSLEESHEEVESTAFVTFHPSYSYEEFVEGLKPVPSENGVKFIVEDGIFKRMAIKAMCEALRSADGEISEIAEEILALISAIESGSLEKYDRYAKSKRILWDRVKSLSRDELRNIFSNAPEFYLIIDEINRGDISKIFGELITLLEADKRLGGENQIIATLPYSKEPFAVPPNLYIIGTMNTADRSIALIDVALRRRFGFVEIMPSYQVLLKELGIGDTSSEEEAVDTIKKWDEKELEGDIRKLAVKVLYILNQKIQLIYDRDHQIGHSYLLKLADGNLTLEQIWYNEIVPLLQEYFYNDWEKLRYILGEYPKGFVEKIKPDVPINSELTDEDTSIFTIKRIEGEEFRKCLIEITKMQL